MTLTFPYPPTVNHYWVHFVLKGHPRIALGVSGKAFRKAVIDLVKEAGPPMLLGRLRVNLVVHPPDHARRDIENICKPLLDALQFAGVYEDDNQIDQLWVQRAGVIRGGKVVVGVEELPVVMPLFTEANA